MSSLSSPKESNPSCIVALSVVANFVIVHFEDYYDLFVLIELPES